MRAQSKAGEHSSAGLAEVAPATPWRVTSVEVLSNWQLQVRFADGLSGLVDMSSMVHSPKAGVFAALADPDLFAQVKLEYGAVAWPGELDLAPDAMHAAIQKRGEWRL